MNDKVIHEAQRFEMSLAPSSLPAPGITGSMESSQQTRSETFSHSHKTRYSDARESENRSKVSNKSLRIVESLTHLSLINLLLLSTVRTMSSSEKRHELALVKRRHEELETQYQVSTRLKEQENRL